MLPEARGANNHRNYIKNSYIEYNLSRVEKLVNNDLAEEVGVEPASLTIYESVSYGRVTTAYNPRM